MSKFSLFKKKIIKEPEPAPLKKKTGAGAGAAKKFTGSPALVLMKPNTKNKHTSHI